MGRLIGLSLFLNFWVVTLYAQNTPLMKTAIPIFVNDLRPLSDGFISANEQDWFIFYAEGGFPYDIRISDVTTDIDPQLEIFDEQGVPLFSKPFSINFEGEGELLSLSNPGAGFYSIKVTNKSSETGTYQ